MLVQVVSWSIVVWLERLPRKDVVVTFSTVMPRARQTWNHSGWAWRCLVPLLVTSVVGKNRSFPRLFFLSRST